MATFDLFGTLTNINNKRFGDCPDNFNNWITYSWMVSTNDEYQLMFLANINNLVNIDSKYFYRLLCCSVNRSITYKWIYPKKENNLRYEIIGKYLGCSKKEARLHEFNNDDIFEMAAQLGYQKNEIKL
jgi:hypothetical protein